MLGTEVKEGVVYSVSLKRVRYGGQQSSSGHLQWNSHVIRTLKSGTVEKLVEHLAPQGNPLSPSYRMCFLCTYRTFTSPDTVLKLLLERYVCMLNWWCLHVYKQECNITECSYIQFVP